MKRCPDCNGKIIKSKTRRKNLTCVVLVCSDCGYEVKSEKSKDKKRTEEEE